MAAKLTLEDSSDFKATFSPKTGTSDRTLVLPDNIADLDTNNVFLGNIEAPSVSVGGDYVSPFEFKNKLINGGFDIWQRGTSFTLSGYTADRWYINQNGETSPVQINAVASAAEWEGATCIGVSSSSVVNTGRNLQQRIENVNLFKNKDITVSLTHNAVFGQDVYVQVRQHDSSGASFWASGAVLLGAGNGTIKRDSVTITLPDIGTKQTPETSHLVLMIFPNYTSSNSLTIANVQLEEGSVATPFEQRPIGLEEMLCKRYFWKMTSVRKMSEHSNGTGDIYAERLEHPNMRIIPTRQASNISYANCSNIKLASDSTKDGCSIILTCTSSAPKWVLFDVELDAEL